MKLFLIFLQNIKLIFFMFFIQLLPLKSAKALVVVKNKVKDQQRHYEDKQILQEIERRTVELRTHKNLSDGQKELQTKISLGVLINNQWVLTCAHCVEDFDQAEESYLLLSNQRQRKQVQKIIVHPHYRPGFGAFDMALVQLLEPVEGNFPLNIDVFDSLIQSKEQKFGNTYLGIGYNQVRTNLIKVGPLNNHGVEKMINHIQRVFTHFGGGMDEKLGKLFQGLIISTTSLNDNTTFHFAEGFHERGDSGGGLFNLQGKVVGTFVAIAENVAFSLQKPHPQINSVKELFKVNISGWFPISQTVFDWIQTEINY